jgi:hypothetical protein
MFGYLTLRITFESMREMTSWGYLGINIDDAAGVQPRNLESLGSLISGNLTAFYHWRRLNMDKI